jgi:hypothetical protein
MTNFDEFSESDGPSMSMRHSDVKQRQHHIYCEGGAEEEIDEQNYIVLRSGSMIPRVH